MLAAQLFVQVMAAYSAFGALFSIAFVLFGIHRVDEGARHAPLGFRMIVMPGVAVLWPLLLARWIRSARS